MSEGTVEEIIELLGTVSAQEFWWDSPLLSLAASTHDARVVRVLAYRHRCLGNKQAYSAHIVRYAVRLCDGADLTTLWSTVDAETDPTVIQERMDDLSYMPWAAALI